MSRWMTSVESRLIAAALVLEVLIIAGYGVLSAALAGSSGAALPSRTVVSCCDSSTAANSAPATCLDAARAANPVLAENTCQGTTTWRLDLPTGPQEAIEGFASPVSANIGDSIHLYVSTTAPSYEFRIYRMGWYQGLGGHLVYSSSRIPGIAQPAPLTDSTLRLVSCTNWRNPVTIPIPSNWVSGVYLVKLASSNGYMRYVTFVVRNDASHSPILFQTSVLTYQAYNDWGGRSLYGGPGADAATQDANRAYAVSLDRPIGYNAGLGDFSRYEFNLLRWMERQGYDVSYWTDVDTDLRGHELLNHRLFVAAGHDEYWSTAMRTAVTQARDANVSLAFFGANDLYWHVRLQASPLGADHVIVCYKSAALDPLAASQPNMATVNWNSPPLNLPERAVLGADYGGIATQPAALVLTNGAAPFFKGTSLRPGSALPGLAAANLDAAYAHKGEYDVQPSGNKVPVYVTVLASSPLTHPLDENGFTSEEATLYAAPSGARVFNAGTFWWGLGLDDLRIGSEVPDGKYSSTDFQQFTANLLAYLLHQS